MNNVSTRTVAILSILVLILTGGYTSYRSTANGAEAVERATKRDQDMARILSNQDQILLGINQCVAK